MSDDVLTDPVEPIEPDKEVDTAVPKKKKKETKVGKPKKLTITFKGNRRFEMKIGREFIVFEGRETKEVDSDLLSHPDFQNKRKYFSIKGIFTYPK